MTPEASARLLIDARLQLAGWVVQDLKALNLAASSGVAVREYPTDTGPADYVLFIDRQAVGVIEAKRDEAGETLTVAERQTARYAHAALKWRKDSTPLPFLFEATGQIIRFTDTRDPAARSRELFHFFKPELLAEWLARPDTLRHRLGERLPPLPAQNLRDCQVSAVTGLEQSLAQNRPRALIHMATGAGKTFTAITSVYRLLKFAGARRILFLVDTRNLGKQAHQEFMAYTPPDDARKFTELYNVQRLATSTIDPHAQVCISTIQRMYSILSGEAIDESAEDLSLNEVRQTPNQAKLVRYNPAVPVETFDFIVIDECHRSIYNLWKQVLDYFDGFLIGLTATPDQRTYGFFNENIVAEYSYEDSVADGVNVGYDVYEIETAISRKGAELKAKEWVDHRDRATRKKRWAETEEDTAYTGRELDRSVVNPSQIRQVIRAMKTAVETTIYPARKETPKTLIFAKTESRPLEKKPGVPLKDLLQGVAMGHRDDDTVLSLANRLVRLNTLLDAKAQARIEKAAGGVPLRDLGRALIHALDPDEVAQAALAEARAKGITRSEDSLLPTEIQAARDARVAAACAAFDRPELRDAIESARRDREQIIDHINTDQVTVRARSADRHAQVVAHFDREPVPGHRSCFQAGTSPTPKHPPRRLLRPTRPARPERRTGQRVARPHPRRARGFWSHRKGTRPQAGHRPRMNKRKAPATAAPEAPPASLLVDLRQLIDASRKRIPEDGLGQRGTSWGEEIVATLSRQSVHALRKHISPPRAPQLRHSSAQ